MSWLTEYHLGGLVIGISTFLIIGLFHPVVIKAEYYWGTRCWWIFLILGVMGIAGSLDKRLAGFLLIRCIFLFFVLDDQGSVRPAETSSERLVPDES